MPQVRGEQEGLLAPALLMTNGGRTCQAGPEEAEQPTALFNLGEEYGKF